MPNARADKIVKALNQHVNNLLMAKVLLEQRQETVGPRQREVLSRFDFRYDFDEKLKNYGEKITDPKYLYLTQSDCTPYYEALDKLHAEMGFKLEKGYCPILVAKTVVSDAERALITASGEFFDGITPDSLILLGLEKRQKFIDMLIDLVTSHPKYTPAKLEEKR